MKPMTLIVAAFALLFPNTSANAQASRRDITVEGVTMTAARWAEAVSRKLDDVMTYPAFFPHERPASGYVYVHFQADDANRPTALVLTRKSGNYRLDKAALRAVSRLGALPPMPSGFRPGQTFVANLLFALDEQSYNEQLALLRKEPRTTQVASSSDPAAVAFVITSHAVAGS